MYQEAAMAVNRLANVPALLPGAPGGTLTETLLYGVHLVLYCICAYILIKRRTRRQFFLLFAATTMFVMATVDISMSFTMVLSEPPSNFTEKMFIDTVKARLYPKNPLYVTNNFISDALLIYRFYMVWGERSCMVVAPAVLLVADTVWGYISIGTSIFSLENIFSPLFLWSVFVFNLIMTAVTAGRIWWIARVAHRVLGKKAKRRYHTAVAIIIESGVVYCISLLMMLIMPQKPFKLIFQAIAIRLVAIMPTLMIVQVELGRHSGESCEDADPSTLSQNIRGSTLNNSIRSLPNEFIFPEKVRDLEHQGCQ